MNGEKRQIVTIDGPAGVGKSTVSLLVAKETGFALLDTGAMYRGVGFYLSEKGVPLEDEAKIERVLDQIKLELFSAVDSEGYTQVILNGTEVTAEIRSSEISMVASKISALKCVRDYLTILQRHFGEKGRVVAEGRDMGSVVFPDAAWKFYLDAQPEVRARRRCQQLIRKGDSVEYKEILEMILRRDKNDSERKIAPLCRAEDAVLVDTTNLSVTEVVTSILERIRG